MDKEEREGTSYPLLDSHHEQTSEVNGDAQENPKNSTQKMAMDNMEDEEVRDEKYDSMLIVQPEQASGSKTPLCQMILLCVMFNISMVAYYGLESLQSSINPEAGLGVTSLGVLCFLISLSSVYGAGVVQKLTPKVSLITGMAGVLMFVIANFYPRHWTLLLGSVCFGSSSGPMFVSQAIVMWHLCTLHAENSQMKPEKGQKIATKCESCTGNGQKDAAMNPCNAKDERHAQKAHKKATKGEKDVKHVYSQFNAWYQFALGMSKPMGLAISAVVLRSVVHAAAGSAMEQDDSINNKIVERSPWENSLRMNRTNTSTAVNFSLCGINHCPYMKSHTEVLLQPPSHLAHITTACYTITAMSALVMAFFLNPVKYKTSQTWYREVLLFLRCHCDIRVLLLLFLFMLTGLQEAMLAGNFYSSFVSCYLGLGRLSAVVICEGIVLSLAALSVSVVSRIIPRQIQLTGSILTNITIGFIWIIFSPSDEWQLFALAGASGATIGIMKANFYPLFATEFPPDIAPVIVSIWFAYTWVCKGVVFFYSAYLCYFAKTVIYIGINSVALVTYVYAEVLFWRRRKSNRY